MDCNCFLGDEIFEELNEWITLFKYLIGLFWSCVVQGPYIIFAMVWILVDLQDIVIISISEVPITFIEIYCIIAFVFIFAFRP